MVLLGVDPHKDTHTVVAVDQAGRELDQATVAGRILGHAELLGWAPHRWPDQRVWAVEDCRHVTGRLERDLLAAGERVVRVPPRLMAGARQAVRALGTSDPIDALAVARAALREPDLPTAGHDQASWRSSCWSTIVSTWSPSAPDDQPAALAPAPARPRPRTRHPTPAWPLPGPDRRLAGRHPVAGSGHYLPGVDGRDRSPDGAHRPAHL
jgi:Transposase